MVIHIFNISQEEHQHLVVDILKLILYAEDVVE
jgi:hypothetical protein